jgi:uroporphyrinogen decarboxylase
VLLGPAALVRERVRLVLEQARAGQAEGAASRGHIFNLGHGILPETPPGHAQLVVDTVRELSGGTP